MMTNNGSTARKSSASPATAATANTTISSFQTPPSSTLSILEGLSKRPEYVSSLVDEALDQFRAQQRIARFCTRQWRRQRQQQQLKTVSNDTTTSSYAASSSSATSSYSRRSKRRKTDGIDHGANNTATTTTKSTAGVAPSSVVVESAMTATKTTFPTMAPSSNSASNVTVRSCNNIKWEHWLWRAMRSSSWSETHLACRLVLQHVLQSSNCNSHSSSSTAATAPVPPHKQRIWDLRDALMHLLQRHVVDLAPPMSINNTTWSSRQVSSQRRQRQDVAWLWISMLKRLIVSEDEDVGILAFRASGGLVWTCQAILRLAMQLQEWTYQLLPWSGTAAVADQRRNLVHRLILLVDLCFHVVLHGSVMIPSAASTNSATSTTAPTLDRHSKKASKDSTSKTVTAATDTATSTTATTTTTAAPPAPVAAAAAVTQITALFNNSAFKSRRSKDESAPAPSSGALALAELKNRRVQALNYVHQFLWRASTSATQHHRPPFDPSLSPLACLLCAYHLLTGDGLMVATSKSSPHLTHCISTLGQLVDPNAAVKVVVSTARSAGVTASSTNDESSKLPLPTTTTAAAGATSATTSTTAAVAAASMNTASSISVFAPSVMLPLRGMQSRDSSNSTTNPQPEEAGKEPKSIDNKEEEEENDVIMVDADHPEDEGDEDDVGGDGDDDDDDEDDDEDASTVDLAGDTAGMAGLVGEDHVVIMERDDDDDDNDDDDDDNDDEVEVEDGDHVILHEEGDDDDDDDSDDDNFMDGDDSDDGGCEDHEDEHDIVIPDDDVARQFEEGLMDLNDGEAMEVDLDELEASSASAAAAPAASSSSNTLGGVGGAASAPVSVDNKANSKERKHALIRAAMQVLAAQHVQTHHSMNAAAAAGTHHKNSLSPSSPVGLAGSNDTSLLKLSKQPLLTLPAESSLVTAMLHVVKPPKKPLNLRIFLRRAPTQEEFFRGSLSKNPISLTTLSGGAHTTANANRGSRGSQEPTVRDLRQYIANDLQMSDSAELLELLVANKILDPNLKLRVVHQVLWRNHLVENTSATLSSLLAGGPSSFLSGSGISAVFGSSLERGGSGNSGRSITADTPTSALPPMMVTYRLAGVDGEATEDTVSELVDPDAPLTTASPTEVEAIMEKEYGITRIITDGRGVFVLLRSIENHLLDTLRRIRRDDVMRAVNKSSNNPSRIKFRTCPPYAGLILLRCCSKLSSNRKKLLQARAPTILLRLLLDVLNALDDCATGIAGDNEQHERFGSNPTAEVLQELIEVLASDISAVPPTASSESSSVAADGYESDSQQDASTLPLLLSSLETIFLSPGLRKVIAKLLPFLTYGQVPLSRELALKFKDHVFVDSLGEFETGSKLSSKSSMLMDTFVQSSIDLPTNEVCNTLRSELVNCGFVEAIANFILKDIPLQPPPWSPPLWGKDESPEKAPVRRKRSVGRREQLEDAWRVYFEKCGLRTAISMMIGLCKNHPPTQGYVARFREDGKNVSLLLACHWMEATSDNSSSRIMMNGLGLLAETLLDEIKAGTDEVAQRVDTVRLKTRERKKEIADERRSKTLAAMSSFGNVSIEGSEEASSGRNTSSVRETAASFLAPVISFFRDNGPAVSSAVTTEIASSRNQTSQPKRPKKSKGADRNSPTKPAWMLEMESMEDEKGLTCAVCQEGRTLQPSELLGLYAYVKKVTLPSNLCGARNLIDGTALLTSLPLTLPDALVGTHAAVEWFQVGKATGDDLRDDSSSSSSSSQSALKRMVYYTTTVSAGNSIHFSCHAKARQADRSHPKAPKSEWEGASLRNSRVSCNVILPLVSSRSSKVPLVAVDSALTDYQTAISNLIGARPKSMLWTVLHDMRFLLLRVAYGETLNADCGGGSLASNSQLLFYQMLMADMFEKDAQVDAPETAQHARNLSAGYLAACAICRAEDLEKGDFITSSLQRHIADAAPMAAMTCILFHNTRDDYSDAKEADDVSSPHPKRRWLIGREDFLAGLLNCAGRRHALGMEDSGCLGSRNRSIRSTSFADWELLGCDEVLDQPLLSTNRKRPALSGKKRSHMPAIDDFGPVLRPMITLFAILDTLSSEYVLNIMDDERIAESSHRLVEVIESCQRSKSIHELLVVAKVSMDHDSIMEELQKGMVSA